jgi:hypothetical protein
VTHGAAKRASLLPRVSIEDSTLHLDEDYSQKKKEKKPN